MGRTRESANLVSDKNIFVDIANDLVGIGTTAPTATLEVSGTLNVSGVSTFQTHVHLGDSDKIRLGASQDLQIYHDTADSYINNSTGTLYARGDTISLNAMSTTDKYFDATNGGAANLYYDNSKKLETKSDGVDITGELQCDSLDVDGAAHITGTITLGGNLDLQDNDQIKLGSGDDLKIYHDGSNSYIINEGTGNLYIDGDTDDLILQAGDDVRIQTQGNENAINCIGDGAVELYHNNSKKFETTSGGVEVTGSVTATSFSGDGSNLTNVPTGFSPINFVLS